MDALTQDNVTPTTCLDDAHALPFQAETADVIVRLRSALAAMVTSVAGATLGKSRDAQKYFNVDVKLSWQLFRTLGAADPIEAVGHIPPPVPFGKLVREARRRRVDEALLGELERAYDRFERHVERHAGDRTSFARMLKSDDADGLAADELPHRQAAFEANRQIWGTEMDVNLHATILHPRGGDPPAGGGRRRFEMVSLGAIRGRRRWRSTAPVLLFTHKSGSWAATGAEADRPRPLDEATFAEQGVPLIGRFCSDPRPALQTRRSGDKYILTELASDAVGRLNSIDVTQGQFFPAVDLMAVPGPAGRLGWRLERVTVTPARRAVMDLIVHRPTFGRLEFQAARLFNTGDPSKSLEELQAAPDVPRLPPVDRVTLVGTADVAGHSAGVDNYDAMLRFVCQQRGWTPGELDVYRQVSEYPLLSTLDSVLFAIPGSERWADADATSRPDADRP